MFIAHQKPVLSQKCLTKPIMRLPSTPTRKLCGESLLPLTHENSVMMARERLRNSLERRDLTTPGILWDCGRLRYYGGNPTLLRKQKGVVTRHVVARPPGTLRPLAFGVLCRPLHIHAQGRHEVLSYRYLVEHSI